MDDIVRGLTNTSKSFHEYKNELFRRRPSNSRKMQRDSAIERDYF